MNHRRFEGPPPSLPGQRMEAPPSLALGTTHLTHRASSPPSTPYSYSATVGNFGSAKRFDYTAIGENINLASRLEGLNKHLGTQILASRDAVAPVSEKLHFRCVGRFRLKGFEKAVEVHELVVEATPWHKLFAEALALFSQRKFDAAEDSFCRVLKAVPEDGPTRFYLDRIRELRTNSPPTGWAGEIELAEK